MATRVLIVDDSAVVRSSLKSELSKDSEIEVVGTAVDPYTARDQIVLVKPDVITLDIEMPRMDGITFLRKLMRLQPMPVIVVSSLTQEGSQLAFEALEAGAVEVLSKPSVAYSIGELGVQLREKVKSAKHINMRRIIERAQASSAKPQKTTQALAQTTNKVIAVGSSTGGTQALELFISGLPPNCPGVIVVQHMPPGFTEPFAKRLDGLFPQAISEARDGDALTPGKVLIAPAGQHALVQRSGGRYLVHIKDGPPVGNHRPAVEVLFDSVARHVGTNALGVMLTGMGKDGAKGMLKMKEAGAINIAQDEASCIVFGMPKAAIDLGGVDHVLPLSDIAPQIIRLLNTKT